MSRKPNIVFMIADDHRYTDIHGLHNPAVHTPNLDRLVKEGTAFMNTHIMGGWHKAVCSPSRACVHTGGYVYHALKNEPEPEFDLPMSNHSAIHPEMAFMPEVLRRSGYHTHAIGKWHNDKESFIKGFSGGDAIFFGGMAPVDQIPLHRFNPDGVYPKEAAVVTEKHAMERFCDAGVRFIEEYEEESPFFLYMAFTSPHDPRTAPKAFADRYDPADIELPRNFMTVHPFDNGEMHVRDEGLARLPRVPQEICRHIADYYAMISHMDSEIGRVLDALRRKGLDDNTIVVYTSDHGLSIGQHGLMGKQNMYDHSIRIPFIVKGPSLPGNLRIHALTCQMDIFPTLCEFIGIPIPDTVDGKSLVSLVNGHCHSVYDSVFSAYKDVQRMVKNEEWKMIRYYRSRKNETGTDKVQLFHLAEDPWETFNLADDPTYRHKLGELLQALEQWQVRVEDPLLKPI